MVSISRPIIKTRGMIHAFLDEHRPKNRPKVPKNLVFPKPTSWPGAFCWRVLSDKLFDLRQKPINRKIRKPRQMYKRSCFTSWLWICIGARVIKPHHKATNNQRLMNLKIILTKRIRLLWLFKFLAPLEMTILDSFRSDTNYRAYVR